MQCRICDAPIDEIDACTCPSCGASLGDVIFSRNEAPTIDTHGLAPIVSLVLQTGDEGESEPSDYPQANEAEERALAESVERHPSQPKKRESRGASARPLPDPHFFCFRLNIGGKVAEYWVRSHKKSPARESLDLNFKGLDLRNWAGEKAPWGLAGAALAIAYKAAMPCVGDSSVVPSAASEYLDAYEELRSKPVWKKV